MRLYHGSNVEVRNLRLLKKQRNLDFGKGFYTTTDYTQAATWARRTSRVRGGGSPIVSVYDMDDAAITGEIYEGYEMYHQERIENAFEDIDSLLAEGRHAF